MTDLKDIEISKDILERDNWQTTYFAYDKIKKMYCLITFPNKKTSWEYSINY